MPILGHFISIKTQDNFDLATRPLRGDQGQRSLVPAWYDVTGSRSGTGNSTNSVNMSLGHAAGQVNVAK